MSFERPYKGLKHVELLQGLAGQYCSMLMAHQRADVIKVEPEGERLGRPYGVKFFAALNKATIRT